MKYRDLLTGILLVLLSAGLTACNYEDSTLYQGRSGVQIDTKLKYENNLFYPINGDEPFTGEVVWRYPDGELAARIHYKDGHLVRRKGFYRDGQILNELELRNDTLVTSVTWFPSGQMKTKYDRGFVKEWYLNGQIKAIWNTDSAGVLEGKAKAWYPDGTLLGVEHYKNGELNGERILFDSTGTVTANGIYRKGEQLKTN